MERSHDHIPYHIGQMGGTACSSGRAGRWNSNGHFMLYTASTRALACLENIVHRRSIGRDELFKITLIEIPDDLKIKK